LSYGAKLSVRSFEMQIKTRLRAAAPGYSRRGCPVALQIEPQRSDRVASRPMPEIHHETIFFSGRVQGVGFRFTTLQVAKEFEVTGFVANLADGRVRLEVEGRAEEVGLFIQAVETRMHGYIRNTERHAEKRAAQFAGFTIK